MLPRLDFLTKEACGCREEAWEWLAEPKPANRINRARLCTSSFAKTAFPLLRRGKGWSQSPVLPWTQRAYETYLSAGSTAMLSDDREDEPHLELHQAGLLTEQAHRSKCFEGDETGVPDRLRSGDLLHERQACWLDYTTGTS